MPFEHPVNKRTGLLQMHSSDEPIEKQRFLDIFSLFIASVYKQALSQVLMVSKGFF